MTGEGPESPEIPHVEARVVPDAERPAIVRFLNLKLSGTGKPRTIRREYAEHALQRRRLQELREHAEFGRSMVWVNIFMFLPMVAWITWMLAATSSGTGMFWQVFLLVIPAMLGAKALGLGVSNLMDRWMLQRTRKQTQFEDPVDPHGIWVRHTYLFLAIGFVLLWVVVSLFPPHQFVQNLIDSRFLLAAAIAALGAGFTTRALFHYEGEDIICTACRSPAPVELGDTCPGCERDLSKLESRFMGRHRIRLRLLAGGVALLGVATAVFII